MLKLPKRPILNINQPPTQEELDFMKTMDLLPITSLTEGGAFFMLAALLAALIGLAGNFGIFASALAISVLTIRTIFVIWDRRELYEPAEGGQCVDLLELKKNWPEIEKYMQVVRMQKRLLTAREAQFLRRWAYAEPTQRKFKQAFNEVNSLPNQEETSTQP